MTLVKPAVAVRFVGRVLRQHLLNPDEATGLDPDPGGSGRFDMGSLGPPSCPVSS
jgi:hypothetical protein